MMWEAAITRPIERSGADPKAETVAVIELARRLVDTAHGESRQHDDCPRHER